MVKTIKLAGIAHSKLRNAIGFVGIEVNPIKQEIHIKFVKQWERNQLNIIPTDITELFEKFQWSNTIIDLGVGSHVIDGLRRAAGLPIKVIFIKKKVTDASEIRRVKQLDLIEMVQFMLQMKLDHKLKFPRNSSPAMKELEDQVALYSEHSTEAGGIDYYAPGDELDNLTKALISVVFAARPLLLDSTSHVIGPITPKPIVTMTDLYAAEQKKHRRKRRVFAR